MEYLADELGVRLRQAAGAPPRPRSAPRPRRVPRAAPPPADAPARRAAHAHREGRRDSGARPPRSPGGASARRLVHTYHGHVLRGYFSPRRELAFRRDRARPRAASPTRSSRSATRCATTSSGSGSRRSKFVVVPYGFDLDARVDAARRDTQADARRGRRRRRHVPRRVRRPADRDQAAARPRADDRGVSRPTPCSSSSATARTARRRRRSRRQLGIAGRCRFVGYRRDVAAWYGAFDALLLTSANEGTPVVAIEALAAGRPVVATDVGGTSHRRRRRRDRAARAGRRHRGARGRARQAGARRAAARRMGEPAPGACAIGSRPSAWSTTWSGCTPRSSPGEGPPPGEVPGRRGRRAASAHPPPRAARARSGRTAPLPRRGWRRCAASTTALDVAAVPWTRVRCGLDVSPRLARDVVARRPARAARPPAHAHGPRGRLRVGRGARAARCRSSRRATTTTATCSARSASSTARSCTARGG